MYVFIYMYVFGNLFHNDYVALVNISVNGD